MCYYNQNTCFVAEILDGKTVGLRLRDHMYLAEVTQNLMRFKEGEGEKEIIINIKNMYDIKACSFEGIVPQNQW